MRVDFDCFGLESEIELLHLIGGTLLQVELNVASHFVSVGDFKPLMDRLTRDQIPEKK